MFLDGLQFERMEAAQFARFLLGFEWKTDPAGGHWQLRPGGGLDPCRQTFLRSLMVPFDINKTSSE